MGPMDMADDQLADVIRRACRVSALEGIGSVTVVPGRHLTEIDMRRYRAIAKASGIALTADESGALDLRRAVPVGLARRQPRARRHADRLRLRTRLSPAYDGAPS